MMLKIIQKSYNNIKHIIRRGSIVIDTSPFYVLIYLYKKLTDKKSEIKLSMIFYRLVKYYFRLSLSKYETALKAAICPCPAAFI